MKKEPLAIIYYTPVENPEEIQRIEVKTKKEFKLIKEKIVKHTKRKRSPEFKAFSSTRIYEIKSFNEIKKKFPSIQTEDIKEFFSRLAEWLYGAAKAKGKYFGLIINKEFLFVYHFKYDTTIDFSKGIEDVVRYFDPDIINWSFFITSNSSTIREFCDISDERLREIEKLGEVLLPSQKVPTKGFEEMITTEPVYEVKGEIKIRCEYDPETDIVVETSIFHLDKLQNSIKVELENRTIKINGIPLTIKEVEIEGKKYSFTEIELARTHIHHHALEISPFIYELEYYSKGHKSYIVEDIKRITIKEDEKEIKTLTKPSRELGDKTTFFILGRINFDINSDKISENLKEILLRGSPTSLVEISRFSYSYKIFDIGFLTLFIKLRNKEECLKWLNIFFKILKNIEGNSQKNLFYQRFLTFLALMTFKKYIQTRNIRNLLYTSSRNALIQMFSSLAKQKHSMELTEIDKLGIEFKTGILQKGKGFFDSSPQKFVEEKLLPDIKRKRKNFIIYLIGINEDTKNFSPIPLNRMRNEFLNEVKERLTNKNCFVHLIESIPLNKERGILCLVISKVRK